MSIGKRLTIGGQEVHPSVQKAVLEIIDGAPCDRDSGMCIACGDQADQFIEPDTRGAPCEACGNRTVYGLEELVVHLGMAIAASEDEKENS